ncbi:hypothetical protein TNCT_458231 [Trichonephila clavata]|uniref:Uncharacterized protein n=1 Tax=Trichonephila clavata TaxID=2740835 RepID=A0A8X6IQ13_TRICU|nr:hypothetical protein TNCT_458231 [Trichonephila clavata]
MKINAKPNQKKRKEDWVELLEVDVYFNRIQAKDYFKGRNHRRTPHSQPQELSQGNVKEKLFERDVSTGRCHQIRNGSN